MRKFFFLALDSTNWIRSYIFHIYSYCIYIYCMFINLFQLKGEIGEIFSYNP